jgi:hypothetical protein
VPSSLDDQRKKFGCICGMKTYLHHCAFSSLLISCSHSSSLLPCLAFSINVKRRRSVEIVRCIMAQHLRRSTSSKCVYQHALYICLCMLTSYHPATCCGVGKGRNYMTHSDINKLGPRKAGAYAFLERTTPSSSLLFSSSCQTSLGFGKHYSSSYDNLECFNRFNAHSVYHANEMA